MYCQALMGEGLEKTSRQVPLNAAGKPGRRASSRVRGWSEEVGWVGVAGFQVSIQQRSQAPVIGSAASRAHGQTIRRQHRAHPCWLLLLGPALCPTALRPDLCPTLHQRLLLVRRLDAANGCQHLLRRHILRQARSKDGARHTDSLLSAVAGH